MIGNGSMSSTAVQTTKKRPILYLVPRHGGSQCKSRVHRPVSRTKPILIPRDDAPYPRVNNTLKEFQGVGHYHDTAVVVVHRSLPLKNGVGILDLHWPGDFSSEECAVYRFMGCIHHEEQWSSRTHWVRRPPAIHVAKDLLYFSRYGQH